MNYPPDSSHSAYRAAAIALMAFGTTALVLTAIACGNSNGAGKPTASPPPGTAASSVTPAGSAASIPTVNVSAREYAYDAAGSIPAGLSHIHMQNAGTEDHQAQLLKLNSGVTFAQFQAALQKGPGAAVSMATAQGGPNTVKGGQGADSIQSLDPGQYVFLCFVPAADGIPHFAKGMITQVQVASNTSAAAAQFPPAPTTITARDFSFDPPATLPAGPATITFKNGGSQAHEMSVIKLNPGVTPDQVKSALSSGGPTPAGPPPFSSVGGMGGIAPGATGQTLVNLSSGTYAMVCNIPDPASGKPHVALGMFSSFNVP
jgi:hypothetical protein